jgi:hypothetical protein
VNKVILNWQRPLWEGDQEVVKSSGKDEPMQVVIYMCMEGMIGISLYSYLYLKLAKMLRGQNSFCLEARGGGRGARGRDGPNNVCNMNKCINNKKHI